MRLEVVFFDELVDACPAFVGRTAADVHEQDIENEIEHTEIGKLTGLAHSVYEIEQSLCGLFEMNVGTMVPCAHPNCRILRNLSIKSSWQTARKVRTEAYRQISLA